jgi:hypothetical protein
MLTDLSFLDVDKKWPPASEVERLEVYAKNRDLFECRHAEVYKEQFKRIERVIGNFEDVISYPVLVNFQKLLSLKFADLLFGEAPKFKTEHEEFVKELDVINKGYECVIDMSRYGAGVFYVYNDDGPVIGLTQPSYWFPVCDPSNIQKVLYHVIAWVREKKLYSQVHGKGYREDKVFECENGNIGKLLSSERFTTGLSDFAIVPVPNIVTSDRITGYDDYTDIDSILSELMIRIGQISRILDKHASPSMAGPLTAVEQDPATGEWRLKLATYFPLDGEEKDMMPQYITWDGQLESSFKMIEELMNQLYVISETGPALFGMFSLTRGQVPERGAAMKRMMVSPLAKATRMKMRMDVALKRVLKLAGEIAKKSFDDVSITWQDGLPGDPLEEAQILSFRHPMQSISTREALMRFDGMTESQAEEEAKRIEDEQVVINGPVLP